MTHEEHVDALIKAIRDKDWDTVDEYNRELRILVERQNPIEIKRDYPKILCTCCGRDVAALYPLDETKYFKEFNSYPRYCRWCGQALRWPK